MWSNMCNFIIIHQLLKNYPYSVTKIQPQSLFKIGVCYSRQCFSADIKLS